MEKLWEMKEMNKKNFPIFISLLIVSLFFTVVFYYGYINRQANYGYAKKVDLQKMKMKLFYQKAS